MMNGNKNKILSGKKVLFIGAVFHRYHIDIEATLEKLGAEVNFCPASPRPVLFSILKNVNSFLSQEYKRRHLREILKIAKSKKFDYIFIVKGSSLTHDFFEKLKFYNPTAKKILYQWDSVKNNDYLEFIKYFDRVFSFDMDDCRKYKKLEYLPLFYADEYDQLAIEAGNRVQDIDLLFIGSMHGDRETLITEVSKICKCHNINFKCHLYRSLYAVVTSLLRDGEYKKVQFTRLSLRKVLELTARSKVILDIHNIGQSGLSIRALEALGAGRKLITTNQNIQNEIFYDKDNISIVNREKLELNINFIKKKITSQNMQIKDFTLDRWVEKIFQKIK